MSTDSTHSRPRHSRTPTDPTQFPQRYFLKVKSDLKERSVYINFNSVGKEFHVTMLTGLSISVLPWLKKEFALAVQVRVFRREWQHHGYPSRNIRIPPTRWSTYLAVMSFGLVHSKLHQLARSLFINILTNEDCWYQHSRDYAFPLSEKQPR
ncbi:hypothetical protein GB937_004082 [Aspergillus fischeri]|nr:hypothetical protein GB937_004082 [Aspergillus fischeri]